MVARAISFSGDHLKARERLFRELLLRISALAEHTKVFSLLFMRNTYTGFLGLLTASCRYLKRLSSWNSLESS